MKSCFPVILLIIFNLSLNAQVFTSSDLPIIIIDTYGHEIPDDPKINAGMKIIDNAPGERNSLTDAPVFDGPIGIEIRGSSSQLFPKKSYGLETWDAESNDIDVSLLGMPAESDWILNANYTDKTLCRNALAYQVSQNMGHYATRYKFVEVMINEDYKGIYLFSEKIKRNANRVDVAKLKGDQNTGDPLTGGYIFKIDKTTGSGGDGWTSDFPPAAHSSGQTIFFQYEYPKSENITNEQKQYIRNYVNDFETALAGPDFANPENGFRKYIIEDTFIDYFLVNEVSKNVDGYRLSTFLHKQRESIGGKLRIGPVWDYDIDWHNANYCAGDELEGWAYQFPCEDDLWQVPFWWERLLQDTTFANKLKCRWTALRGNILSDNWFDEYFDSVALLLDEPQERNFIRWPIPDQYVWPNPWPYPATYAEEMSSLKAWIHFRLAWMDANLPGNCYNLGLKPEASRAVIQIYPNPANDLIYISTAGRGDKVIIAISDLSGRMRSIRQFKRIKPGIFILKKDISDLPGGLWLIKITDGNQTFTQKFIKQ
jgi:hypothetical protein